MARTTPDTPPTVRFYQAAGGEFFQLIARLATKAVERGLRLFIVAANPEHAQLLDQHLWCHPENSFLPHGLESEPNPELQPILIGTTPNDQNGATVLIVANSLPLSNPGQFDLVVDFAFASNLDPRNHLASRQRYSHYRNLGCTMEYWVQSPAGGWEKKI
ncbi:MAG: DNA polymerase III subunit chi [Magnetococcus sp. DMHC-1]|nr:DNA polymerase III subunit chi [Magnetococcales bacterium]